MKNLLFPKGFRIVGWVMFVPAVIMAALCYFEVCSVTGIVETILNDAIIIGIALGSVFIVCSKEQQEDEMTRAIRLSALMNALYVYVVVLIASTIVMNGIRFLMFAVANLVLLPVIYVIIFRLEMHRYNKMCEDEE